MCCPNQLGTKLTIMTLPKKLGHPKKLGPAWWLCKDRGQRVQVWGAFIGKLGGGAREGTLRGRSRVQPCHSLSVADTHGDDDDDHDIGGSDHGDDMMKR